MQVLVHLYDCDNTGFPNLALLKLSQWHREQGDEVIWNFPLIRADKNYGSAVFSWSGKCPPGDYEVGGWGINGTLPDVIEHTQPDYSNLAYSIGFLSRGCIRHCSFCVVPEREGHIRPHSLPREFIQHDRCVLLDNNWLASPRWEQDWEWLHTNRIKCDFNQGLDARLVDRQIAERLAKLRWSPYIRVACDNTKLLDTVKRCYDLLSNAGYTKELFVYVLVKDIDDAHHRVTELYSHSNKIAPFAQPYRNESGDIDAKARRFARWVNHKAIFKTVKWEGYR